MASSPIIWGRILESVNRPWVFWAGCLWGFAEATLFFVVPDVLLTVVALYTPRRSVKLLGELARLERFAPFWLAASALGMIFCERIQRKSLIPAIAHLSLWILGYAWYWSKIG